MAAGRLTAIQQDWQEELTRLNIVVIFGGETGNMQQFLTLFLDKQLAIDQWRVLLIGARITGLGTP